MEDVDEANAEDIALMQRIAAGDESAFEALITKHQRAVVGTIGKMTNFSPDSRDLAQEVFLRIWKSAARYKPTAKFTTYLFTITRNLVFNYSRKKQRTHEHSLEELEEDWHQQICDPTPLSRPDASIQQQELRVAVDQAISSLPEKQRMAVILRRYEQMPYEDIATTLELSVSAVKSQLFRARAILREELGKFLDRE